MGVLVLIALILFGWFVLIKLGMVIFGALGLIGLLFFLGAVTSSSD